jgi:hypothetical protein
MTTPTHTYRCLYGAMPRHTLGCAGVGARVNGGVERPRIGMRTIPIP